MDTAIETNRAARCETLGTRSGQVGPELRFSGVRRDGSQLQQLQAPDPSPTGELEVVVPPLAPFSVVGPRGARAAGQNGPASTNNLWIRYDATSPMAVDRGLLVVADRGSGRRWTVTLLGSGELAKTTERSKGGF